MSEESTGTVVVAGVANLLVALAKLVGGLLSGSAVMLAEAAHSVADTLNQVFLLAAVKRSHKRADAQHPFGYGMERYFWALLSAVGIFVLGAGFSVAEGLRSIFEPEELTSLVVVYAVLGASFVFEGVSWLKALRQVRREASQEGHGPVEHVQGSTDPALRTVAFEDTAALVGILLAAAGVTLHAVTGQAFWDGATSIAVGLLLVVVAYELGRNNKAMLIGQALDDEARRSVHAEIERSKGVDRVVELFTMRLGAEEVLVAAKVDLEDEASGEALEQYADAVERRVREVCPQVRHVFLDPTPSPS